MQKLSYLLGMLLIASLASAQLPDFIGQTKNLANWEQKANAWKIQHRKSGYRNAVANNYNVVYDRCQWNVDPAVYYLSGSVTTFFVPTSSTLSQMELDFSSAMKIDSVKYHGANITYKDTDDVLSISFPSSINKNVLDSVSVYYQGAPLGSGFGSFTQYTHGNNVPVIWTLSEPYGAKDWWPCKQSLDDKIDSIDIYVTCPKQYRDGSNGVLISETQNGLNKTYHWKSHYPIAAYLVAIAVTNYAQYSDYATLSNGNSLQVLNYVYPEDSATARALTPAITGVIHLYDSLVTDYPFANEKFGHCEFSWGGGMEHQTMTYVSLFDEYIIAHECAHQWFGDKVTLGSWQDIWLNEGFATYFEGLTQQDLYPANWDAWKQQHMSDIVSLPDGSVFCTDTTDLGRIFDSRLSYSKGAYVLHMLRWKLGDVNFFNALRQYVTDANLAYKYARTSNLKQKLESVSGQDLTAFFNQWFYGQGYPTYNLRWYTVGKSINVTFKQTQSDPSVSYFQMPVPLELKDATHDTTVVLNNTSNAQSFAVKLSFTPTQMILDPKMWIIHANDVITKIDTTGIIITNPISGSPFCPKATVSVSYDAAGTFLAGNVFTAQLSNATGSFASPTKIGTLTSTSNSGAITAALPLSIAAGTGYRIRVISSKPAVTGLPNTSNLTINTCVTPANVNAGSIAKTTAVISWNAVPCAYNYKLQYRKSGTTTWTAKTTSGTSYTITALTGKTKYDYEVQTICTSDGTSTSAFSAIKNFTTLNKREELNDGSESALNDVSIFPNPARNNFTVQITSTQEVSAIVIMYNMMGEEITTQNVHLDEGVNTVPFESLSLPSGLYLISVQTPDEKMIRKLTISK